MPLAAVVLEEFAHHRGDLHDAADELPAIEFDGFQETGLRLVVFALHDFRARPERDLAVRHHLVRLAALLVEEADEEHALAGQLNDRRGSPHIPVPQLNPILATPVAEVVRIPAHGMAKREPRRVDVEDMVGAGCVANDERILHLLLAPVAEVGRHHAAVLVDDVLPIPVALLHEQGKPALVARRLVSEHDDFRRASRSGRADGECDSRKYLVDRLHWCLLTFR